MRDTTQVTPESVFIFLLNNEEYDFALLAVDVMTRKFILYDCVGCNNDALSRPKETFLLHVKKIRRFLADLFAHIKVHSPDESHRIENVDGWKYEAGVCSKFNSTVLDTYGQGVFIMKFIDSLTQC